MLVLPKPQHVPSPKKKSSEIEISCHHVPNEKQKFYFCFNGGSLDDMFKGILIDLDTSMNPTQCQEYLQSQINGKIAVWLLSISLKMNEYEIDLNDYKKIESIGKGGFGEVYLVENIKTNKKYAAKIIKTQSDHEEEEEEVEVDKSLFLNEVITNISMNNPAILKIIGYCYCDFSKPHYITMILDYMPKI